MEGRIGHAVVGDGLIAGDYWDLEASARFFMDRSLIEMGENQRTSATLSDQGSEMRIAQQCVCYQQSGKLFDRPNSWSQSAHNDTRMSNAHSFHLELECAIGWELWQSLEAGS